MIDAAGKWEVAVPGWGDPGAPLVIIGEAPGPHEVNATPPRPFCGPSGYRLDEWMESAGLSRTHAYIDNVYPFRPPGNKIERVPHAAIKPYLYHLHDRVAALLDPIVIVPLGNYALYALLNLGKVAWDHRDGKHERPGITSHRGYIYTYVDLHGRSIKVIPSVHPAATFDQPALERAALQDWAKIAGDLRFRDTAVQARTILSHPTAHDLTRFVADMDRDAAVPVSFDIERPAGTTTTRGKPTKAYPDGKPTKKKDYRAGTIACISFSLDPFSNTIVVPMGTSYWKKSPTPLDPWDWVRVILERPNPKCTQNGLYDNWHLLDQGIQPNNWLYDTLYLHHARNPRSQHSLEYLASIYLRTQYWKQEAKDPESISGWTEQEEKLRHYCGLDSSHTLELLQVFQHDLTIDWWQRYLTHYLALLPPLLRLMRHGFRVDRPAALQHAKALKAEFLDLKHRLADQTGTQLIATKDVSNKKLAEYLYRDLKLPEQHEGRGRNRRVTVNEIAVKTLMERYPEQLPRALGEMVLRARRVRKLGESYAPQHFDDDDRMRSTYSPAGQAGRLISKKNPSGSGTNGQNSDEEARGIFLADGPRLHATRRRPDDHRDRLLLTLDLSQAESRVNRAYIYSLTGDEETIWKARALPADWDDHTEMTKRIFGRDLPDETITARRPLGKRVVHASQRQMQSDTLAKNILKETGEVVLPHEANRLLRLAVAAQPGLTAFFRWVEFQCQMNRRVTSCWGVSLDLTYDRLDAATYREAISFLMQDAVGRLTNQYGVRWMWEEPDRYWQDGVVELNAQWHDGLLTSVPPDPVFIADYAAGLGASLSRPISCNGVELSIPVEVKLGTNAGSGVSWKSIPDVNQLTAAIDQLYAEEDRHAHSGT